MSMVLNEDQQLLKDSAKNFLQERTPVAKMRKQRDEGLEWSKSLWGAMAEMGWTGVVIPEALADLASAMSVPARCWKSAAARFAARR